MEKKQKALKVISVINSILLILAMLVCMLIIMTNTSPYYIISSLAEFLALLFSLFYFFNLYKKRAANFYSLFMVFYAFTYLAEMIACLVDFDSVGVTSRPGVFLASMILYGNTLILAVGKDLGKKVSYILCGINVVFYALPILGVVIPGIVTFDNTDVMKSNVLLYCVWFIMALNAFVMTAAKYTDKAIRGSK